MSLAGIPAAHAGEFATVSCFNHLQQINCIFLHFDLAVGDCVDTATERVCTLFEGGWIGDYHWVNPGTAVIEGLGDSCLDMFVHSWIAYGANSQNYGCLGEVSVPAGACTTVTRTHHVWYRASAPPPEIVDPESIEICAP